MNQQVAEEIRRRLLAAGACAVGFAPAGPVEPRAVEAFDRWLAAGNQGALSYMERNRELRLDPRGLLDGCHTVVSTAWLYNPRELRDPALPYLARYAYCRDYHNALRSVLKPLMRQVEADFGYSWRICIDSAPVIERYWAVKSGIGFCGRSGLLIVPGVGSRVFLAEVLLAGGDSLPGQASQDNQTTLCDSCDRCVRACPGNALTLPSPDCRRCLSALTIEVPGSAARVPRTTLMGCDVCQDVCPYNREDKKGNVAALATLPHLLKVSAEELRHLTDADFRTRYAGTPLMRVGLAGLLHNLQTPS